MSGRLKPYRSLRSRLPITGVPERPKEEKDDNRIRAGLLRFLLLGRNNGLIGPTNPLIHASTTFAHCGTGDDSGLHRWTARGCGMPPEYSTFQPLLYSVDVILPLVELGQEADWAPVIVNRQGETLWGGRVLRWIMWFEILFGWFASLMFIAIAGRLVDKD